MWVGHQFLQMLMGLLFWQKVAECKWFWMHSQMGAASFVYNVGVLLVTIAKTSTMPIGVAKPDAQVCGMGILCLFDLML